MVTITPGNNYMIFFAVLQVDTWFSVDRATGDKRGTISVHGCSKFDECPNSAGPSDFLIGRTEYNVMMYDSSSSKSHNNKPGSSQQDDQGKGQATPRGKSWNVTFYDYSSNLAGDVGPDYGRQI